ncbi:PREDICTED: uncharacterized protein LOC109177585 isoform X1 [Ipomoea nil]|uniref:uncharacterized protein LOC109177585 isoform X1 n=1 Tax=Ipomoea nil TaxID=35883 RepID=UPI000901F978|nr:PREDICTED: uncharacterized protein LOC109177585 isoform X1 [Ipomoea nil]
MAAISQPARRTLLLPRLKALVTLQKFNQTSAGDGIQLESTTDRAADSNFQPGKIEFSNWRKLDARHFGITGSRISPSSWVVLNVLKKKGFKAYLVGGCVRDLILNRIPKDFDVITTARLNEIKKQFYRAEIVGRRFPICRVHIRGSVVEVSSFDTVANKGDETKRKNSFVPRMPKGCNESDVIRWRNSLHRDFTINSLFYDPFVYQIYDYANAMADIKSQKLRTLIPAQLSFEEDCARILRGLRLAARLKFSFSMETETAIWKLSPSVMSLDKSRLMMEVNYMLSYGAAVPSLCLLQKYNLLEVLLPFHAAYLTQQADKQSSDTSMLMKLFSSLDQLVSCERPARESLWVALLAFHLTLVNNPQPKLVVLTLASVMYHRNWKQGVEFARQHVKAASLYVPEISDSDGSMSEDELAKRVENMAVQVNMLTDADNLREVTSKFSGSSHSGLVFVSNKMVKKIVVEEVFGILTNDVTSLNEKSCSLKIQNPSPQKGTAHKKGNGIAHETRFLLSKIILDTLGLGGVILEEGESKKRNSEYDEIDGLQEVKENSHSQMEMKQEDYNLCNISPMGGEFEPARAKKRKSTHTSSSLSEEGAVTKHKKSADEQTAFDHSKCLQKVHESATKHKKSVDESEFTQRESSEELVKRKLNSHPKSLGADDMVEHKKSKKTLFDLFK